MRACIFIGVICTLLSICPAYSEQMPCGLESSAVTSPFAGVSDDGKIEFSRKLAAISLGDGLEIPFNIQFNAKDPSGSQILGNKWFFGPTDSKLVKTSENEILLTSPTGQLMPFAKRDGIWRSGKWILENKDYSAIIQSPCGIDMTYSKGRFVSLAKNNKTILEVLRDPNSEHCKIVTSNNNIIITPSATGFIVENLVDDKFEIHRKFSANENQFGFKCHNLSVELSAENDFLILRNSDMVGHINSYKIDRNSLNVIADNDWKYSSTPKNNNFELCRVSLKDDSVFESWYEDRSIGLKITKDSRFGEMHYKKYVTGPNAGALRSITKETGNGVVYLQQHYYDTKGRKIRSIVGDDVEEFRYDDLNRIVSHTINDKFIWEKTYDQKNRIVSYKNHKKNCIRFEYDPSGERKIVSIK